jgi:cytochrome c oxidase subunit 2
LSKYDEYNKPTDPTDPESDLLWEDFNYELACAELCGASHFSMRRTVRIVSEGEYEAWLANQQSYYMNSIRNSDEDPYADRLFDVEIRDRKVEFNTNVESALNNEDIEAKTIPLTYVKFETGSAVLTPLSKYELDNLVEAMKKYPDVVIEVAGHTDNTGNPESNLLLSQNRADAVKDYVTQNGVEESRLRSLGYGQTQPVDTNDTESGRAKNRRTEVKIIAQ